MLSPEQIRAARALLDWSTSTLADLAGMTINGINKIERGHVQAQRETIETIQRIFEAHGLEFLPGSGVRRKNDVVTVLEGQDFRKRSVSFWREGLKNGGCISIAHENEQEALEDAGEDFLHEELRKRAAAGITHKVLVREADKSLIPPYSTYHIIPDQYFSPYPLEIGGEFVLFSSRKYAPRAIILHDSRIANSLQKIFDFVYDHTEIPQLGKDEIARYAKQKTVDLEDQ